MTQIIHKPVTIQHEFHIKILGRMLEHLGVQMYKRRDAAIAELVANCWDAGANNVWITIPSPENYNKDTSEIYIEDDGTGMNKDDMQDKYLVIGRNRREDEASAESNGRRVMGRKGIGKLAGFGIASKMTILTWKDEQSIELTLDLNLLNQTPREEENPEKTVVGNLTNGIPQAINGTQGAGTKVILNALKQITPIKIDELHEALSRRFSRTVQGIMKIHVNGEELKPFNLILHPKSRKFTDGDIDDKLTDGNIVKYNWVYTDKPIPLNELRGWTILVNGKTAQKPNFFFEVDAKGSSQHSSKYLCGDIEADYLDSGIDDESDLVSTDRQEIDWERPETQTLWNWGRKITQEIFNIIADRNSEDNINVILEDETFEERIKNLDPESQKKVRQFVKSIGTIQISKEGETDVERIKTLGDQIIKAFEYRHFVDVIEDIENASSDSPEELQKLLSHLSKWEVLESRSILEVIKGRLKVIDKFFNMIVNDAPETANREINADNFHDLIAGFPWLLNPEWQVFLEEKRISTLLKAKGLDDFKDAMEKKRIDFLAMQGDGVIAIIEIKRPGDVLPFEELRKLEDYKNAIQPTEKKPIICVLIYSGKHSVPEDSWKSFQNREDFLILEWKDIFVKNRVYYEHYGAVLENHLKDPNFKLKEEEIKYTRKMLEKGSIHRTKEDRKTGLGSQDMKYIEEQMKNIIIDGNVDKEQK